MAVLNGEETVWLSASVPTSKFEKEAGYAPAKKKISKTALPENCEAELLKDLKALRTKIAGEKNVPAYIIFSDKTLIELASYLPHNLAEIRQISGFGDFKVNQYGLIFLTSVLAYCKAKGLSSRMNGH